MINHKTEAIFALYLLEDSVRGTYLDEKESIVQDVDIQSSFKGSKRSITSSEQYLLFGANC